MPGVILLVLFIVVAVAIGRQAKRPAPSRPPVPDAFAAALARAVARGVITGEQAEAVLAVERATVAPSSDERRSRIPRIVEALGYLGAVLVIVGAMTLVSR